MLAWQEIALFIIHGTSDKQAVVGQIHAQCPSCGIVGPHVHIRLWRVEHALGFPLFSHRVAHVLGCPSCQAAHPFVPTSGNALPLPFLHRFGCSILVLLAILASAALALAFNLWPGTEGPPRTTDRPTPPTRPGQDESTASVDGNGHEHARPCVLQAGAENCGPAALETIALYYGMKLTPEARKLMMDTDHGSSLLSLRLAAEALGFEAKGVKLNAEADPWEVLNRAPKPMIAHVLNESGLGHYVVIYETTPDRVQIADPAKGLRDIPKDEFLARWTGKLLLLAKSAGEEVPTGEQPK